MAKSSEIYRKAAERIANRDKMMKWDNCCDGGCLNSCCMVSGIGGESRRVSYAKLFAPEWPASACAYWGNDWGRDAHRCRILALCFMAAISESEGD